MAKIDERGTVPVSARITPECYELWHKLAEEMGLSLTGVLETAIRRMARPNPYCMPWETPEQQQEKIIEAVFGRLTQTLKQVPNAIIE